MLNNRLVRTVCSKNLISPNSITKQDKIIHIADKNTLHTSLELLNQGEVIALPTDTVYGLACNANDSKAVQKLYDIKRRNRCKPVAICVADLKHLNIFGNAAHLSEEMLKHLLPGAVTIVLNKTRQLNNPHLNPGVDKIGIRIPKYDFILNLCKSINYPLALTSANISNEGSSFNIHEFENIWSQLGVVIDGGQLGLTEESKNASTVIDLSYRGLYTILRPGVSYNETINIMKNFNIKEFNP